MLWSFERRRINKSSTPFISFTSRVTFAIEVPSYMCQRNGQWSRIIFQCLEFSMKTWYLGHVIWRSVCGPSSFRRANCRNPSVLPHFIPILTCSGSSLVYRTSCSRDLRQWSASMIVTPRSPLLTGGSQFHRETKLSNFSHLGCDCCREICDDNCVWVCVFVQVLIVHIFCLLFIYTCFS